MKKITLSLLALLTFGAVSAQDLTSKKGEYYLPQQGDWSIGFDASNALKFIGNSFNGNTSNEAPGFVQANEFGFVGKRFISDNQAYRYIANLQFTFEKVTDVTAVSTFGLTAGFGKEWRKGSTRLQGFYGIDGLVSFAPKANAPQTNVFTLGAQGFVGAEYFFLPKMSIGAQYTYGAGLSYSKAGASHFGFVLGGVGTTSLLFNLYF